MLDKIPLHEISGVTRGEIALRSMFLDFDTDGDGSISRSEFEKGMLKIGISTKISMQFFDEMDTDNSECLTPAELYKLAPDLENHAKRIFKVSTIADGYNNGRSFFFQHIASLQVNVPKDRKGKLQRTPSSIRIPRIPSSELSYKDRLDRAQDAEDACNSWIAALQREAESAIRRNALQLRWQAFQESLSRGYHTSYFQSLVAFLIGSNFALTAAQLQVLPEPGSAAFNQFEMGDYLFTAVFTLELALNMTAHWWKPFWASSWNVFDFVIVSVTLISLSPASLPGIKFLRLIRAFRVLRIFARLASLRMLISALTASFLPVANAIIIVLLVVAIFSVLGVSFFNETDPAHFRTFAQSMFTMFQVMTFDDWGEIARSHFSEEGNMQFLPSMFFASFLLIVSFTLLPVVVAVLLDNFTTATRQEKDQMITKKAALESVDTVGSIDQVVKILLSAPNQEALKQLIRQIFQRLNLDQSGQMSFHDMRDGLKRMPFLKPIRLTEQDFEQITLGRTLCNDEGQLELAQFEALLRREMLLYCHRQLSVSVPAVLKDDQHMGILMFAVKLVLDMSQDLCSAATVGTQQLGLPRSHSNSDFLATRQAHIPIKSRACSQDRESVEPTTSGRPHQEAALWSLVQRVADLEDRSTRLHGSIEEVLCAIVPLSEACSRSLAERNSAAGESATDGSVAVKVFMQATAEADSDLALDESGATNLLQKCGFSSSKIREVLGACSTMSGGTGRVDDTAAVQSSVLQSGTELFCPTPQHAVPQSFEHDETVSEKEAKSRHMINNIVPDRVSGRSSFRSFREGISRNGAMQQSDDAREESCSRRLHLERSSSRALGIESPIPSGGTRMAAFPPTGKEFIPQNASMRQDDTSLQKNSTPRKAELPPSGRLSQPSTGRQFFSPSVVMRQADTPHTFREAGRSRSHRDSHEFIRASRSAERAGRPRDVGKRGAIGAIRQTSSVDSRKREGERGSLGELMSAALPSPCAKGQIPGGAQAGISAGLRGSPRRIDSGSSREIGMRLSERQKRKTADFSPWTPCIVCREPVHAAWAKCPSCYASRDGSREGALGSGVGQRGRNQDEDGGACREGRNNQRDGHVSRLMNDCHNDLVMSSRYKGQTNIGDRLRPHDRSTLAGSNRYPALSSHASTYDITTTPSLTPTQDPPDVTTDDRFRSIGRVSS